MKVLLQPKDCSEEKKSTQRTNIKQVEVSHLFGLEKVVNKSVFNNLETKERKNKHTHRNSITQRKSNALRFTTNPNMTRNRPSLRSLNA
jgi:hypothetical protein